MEAEEKKMDKKLDSDKTIPVDYMSGASFSTKEFIL